MTDSPARAPWPELPYEEWAPTKKTLQMCSQMLGKLKLALLPPQPEWMHTAIYLDAHGFGTGALPCDGRVVSAGIDVYASRMWIRASDGRSAVVELGQGRCVADIWSEFHAALEDLGVKVDLWQKPQETADETPFSENRHDCTIVAEHAQRFHQIVSAVDGVFEEFRSPFFGRTGIQLWWGAFDFAVLLFNGKHENTPDDKGYIMRYDLDAQMLNAGLWFGDDSAPYASFYAYIVPRPDGCETAPMQPEHANWVDAMGEWMLPYDAVRASDDPHATLLAFLNSTYAVATDLGGWDARDHAYTLPAPSERGA